MRTVCISSNWLHYDLNEIGRKRRRDYNIIIIKYSCVYSSILFVKSTKNLGSNQSFLWDRPSQTRLETSKVCPWSTSFQDFFLWSLWFMALLAQQRLYSKIILIFLRKIMLILNVFGGWVDLSCLPDIHQAIFSLPSLGSMKVKIKSKSCWVLISTEITCQLSWWAN